MEAKRENACVLEIPAHVKDTWVVKIIPESYTRVLQCLKDSGYTTARARLPA